MWDKIADIFSINEDYEQAGPSQGQRVYLLDYLDLRDWYEDLPPDKQQLIRENKKATGIGGGEVNLMDQKLISTDMTQQDFLAGVVKSSAKENEFEFAEKVLPKALSAKGRSADNEHFMYKELHEAYYKQRGEREDAIEKCIEYCQKDIEIIDEFLNSWDGEQPRVPSFKRLAIIYEKQEEYQKAVEICDEAITRELSDNTKGGFEGRKQRLLKKMNE